MKIGINGFGRIGRSIYRILAEQGKYEVVAVNDLSQPEMLRYLLQYDSVMRKFPHQVRVEGRDIITAKQKTTVLSQKDPALIPWKDHGVDIVIESTGRFLAQEELLKHISAGAQKVLLTVPPKGDIDAMIVMGVNDHELKASHRTVSNASCTTNCLSPVMKVLHREFGVKRAFMNTIHAYTNDQRVYDDSHKDLRRARSALTNMIITTTGAAKSVGKVIPDLKGKLDGVSLRVPTIDGSMVDLTCNISKKATAMEINAAFKKAAQSDLKGIMEYCEDPIVSSDIIHNTHSTIIDSLHTKVVDDTFVKIVAWYDNEWGYSNRVVDLLDKMITIS